MRNKPLNKFAFTLAEVLVTLGIIGVVASLVIPTLIQNSTDAARIGALKKAYSTISNAFNLAVNENGTPDNWNLGYAGSPAGSKNIAQNLAPYLKVVKEVDKTGFYELYLADGSYFDTWVQVPNCDWGPKKMCGILYYHVKNETIDKNGQNTFWFWINKNKIEPMGLPDDGDYSFTDYCKKSNLASGSNIDGQLGGRGCTAWALYNNNLDYLHCDGLSWNGQTKCQ